MAEENSERVPIGTLLGTTGPLFTRQTHPSGTLCKALMHWEGIHNTNIMLTCFVVFPQQVVVVLPEEIGALRCNE